MVPALCIFMFAFKSLSSDMSETSSRTAEPQTLVLLGIPFHDVTTGEALDHIGRLIELRRPSFVVTANLDFAAKASKDVELQRIFVEADMVLCDGAPILWTSRLTNHPLRERVAGSDIMPLLAARAALKGWRIFLFGGAPDSLEKAAANLKLKHPDITIAGTYSPPFAPLHEYDDKEIATRIREASPDILLVALGCPKQEKWIYKHYREIGVPCSIGVGACIDFLAGKVYRAPELIARIGFEWLFRMLQEPRRLTGRYIQDAIFLISQLLREKSADFRRPKKTIFTNPHKIQRESSVEIIVWDGPLIAGTLSRLEKPNLARPFIIDLSKVTRIDSAGLGHLLQTMRHAWAKETPGYFSTPSDCVHAILQITRLDRVIPLATEIAHAQKLLSDESFRESIRPEVVESGLSMLVMIPPLLMKDNVSTFFSTISEEWAKRPSLRELKLDFAGTRFVDSSGLGFLVKCHRMVGERDSGTMELLRIPPAVRNVIRIARLETSLGISD